MKKDLSLKLCTLCSEHGGHSTAENLDKMDELNYKKLVDVVSNIMNTIEKEIKTNKRVIETEKLKMVPLPAQTLKTPSEMS